MELLLTITYTLLFIFLIHRMRFFETDGISRRGISFLFLLKVLSGIVVWAVYTFYYTDRATADIYKYFDDSKVIYDSFRTRPDDFFRLLSGIGNNTPAFDHYYSEMNYWARKVDSSIYNDSHTIIRFNALLRFFSMGYYNVHTVIFCFLSLTGLTAIYKTFVGHLQNKKRELLFAVFLLPSVLFWGSGALKEALIFFALGLLIYHADRLFRSRSVLIFLLVTLLLAFSKFYVWLCVIPGIILLVLVNKTSSKKIFLKFLVVLALISILGLNSETLFNIQSPFVTLSLKQQEFMQLGTGQFTDSGHNPIPAANSLVNIRPLEPTPASFIKNSPQALVNTFLRPYLWECRGPLMLLSGLETLLVLFLIAVCIVFMKDPGKISWLYVLFCLSFVLLQFLIIGETTPVLGAIARYKTIALPFLLIGFLFVLNKERMLARLPFLKKILN
ncbi:MAG: hypothetical protein ACJ77K_00980 [Bacteroidia bacterium]